MSFRFDLKKVDGDLSFRTRYQTGIRIFPLRSGDLPSRTKQADAKASDINFIVSRYRKTGELPVVQRAAMFADLSLPDFKDAMDVMVSAQQSFAALPALTRSKFNNDPAALLEALDKRSDPKVAQYLYEAGMLKAPPVPQEELVDKPAKAKAARPHKAGAAKPDDVSSEAGD